MSQEAFGNHPVFRQWDTAREISGGDVTFGATVIPHLIEGLTEFLASPASRTYRKFRSRVALGMVPWLTNTDVAQLLARLDGVCITVDKRSNDKAVATKLNEEGTAMPASWLGMETLGAPDDQGRPPLIHPSGTMPGDETVIGPVRSAGYRQKGRDGPLLHAKMLVLCHSDSLDYGEAWDGRYLQPVKVWLGSANWTANAPDHLEFGLWSSDPSLVQASLEFLRDVVRVSEPFGAATERPEPEFVEADWDDEAFAEAASSREPDEE